MENSIFTCYGIFEWLVMPLRLTNTPANIQYHLNSVLYKPIDWLFIVYRDEILICSKKREEHIKHVRHILQLLRDNKLFAKSDNCKSHTQFVEYLGLHITPNGGEMRSNPTPFHQPSQIQAACQRLGQPSIPESWWE